MAKGKIILLNGVSSSGKSTLAEAYVKERPDFFHMRIDDFDLFIEKMEDRQYGHLIPIDTEYFFHRNIAMFSECGVNVIVDHVLHNEATQRDFFEVLGAYPLLCVGVHCPEEELMRREKNRGDRHIGLALSQLDFVHQTMGETRAYDLEVNTYTDSLEVNLLRLAHLC